MVKLESPQVKRNKKESRHNDGTADVLLVYAPHAAQYDNVCLRFPLGLLYVGSVLRQQGFRVKLLDFQREELGTHDLLELVRRDRPAWVGFTCDADNIFRVQRLCRQVLDTDSDVVCVLGGPQVSVQPNTYVAERIIVVRGEGEYAALQLTRHLVHGQVRLENVPGITYLHRNGRGFTVSLPIAGNVAERPSHGLSQTNAVDYGPYLDLSQIPLPDLSLLTDMRSYVMATTTSRGCPYHCRFCVEGAADSRYRARSIDDVERELEAIRKAAGDRSFYLQFADDTFTSSPKRVRQICDAIDRVFPNKDQFAFFCEGRVNILGPHPDLLYRLKEAGLIRLQIGIEAGSQDLLNAMGKQSRTEQIETVIQTCEEADICSVFGVFIFGLPGQQEHHLREGLEFAKRLIDLAPGRLEIDATILATLAGTEYCTSAGRWGLRVFDPDFVTGDVTLSCCAETESLTAEQIRRNFISFKAETRNHFRSKLESVSPVLLRQMIRVHNLFRMVALPLRELFGVDHFCKVMKITGRTGVDFMDAWNGSRSDNLCPRRMSDNMRRVGNRWLINESSPFGYLLNDEEMAAYRLFAGKLSFAQIADRLMGAADTPNSIDRQAVLDHLWTLYHKCEQRMNAVLTDC